jgi:hypothetical protein
MICAGENRPEKSLLNADPLMAEVHQVSPVKRTVSIAQPLRWLP